MIDEKIPASLLILGRACGDDPKATYALDHIVIDHRGDKVHATATDGKALVRFAKDTLGAVYKTPHVFFVSQVVADEARRSESAGPTMEVRFTEAGGGSWMAVETPSRRAPPVETIINKFAGLSGAGTMLVDVDRLIAVLQVLRDVHAAGLSARERRMLAEANEPIAQARITIPVSQTGAMRIELEGSCVGGGEATAAACALLMPMGNNTIDDREAITPHLAHFGIGKPTKHEPQASPPPTVVRSLTAPDEPVTIRSRNAILNEDF